MLCKQGDAWEICVSENDNIGVRLAAQNVAKDFRRVCNSSVSVTSTPGSSTRILAGTVGESEAIDRLAKKKKIDVSNLRGKHEMYYLFVEDSTLVVAGADRRGTIYGLYEISKQIGVSPWCYWMDVPTEQHDKIFVRRGTYTDGQPAVRYRGIFLNDEGPCLMTWVKNTFHTDYGDHRFYEKVFELILRLRGNYIWPAMWAWAFYADDPLNSKTADDMGIIVGTSHHEPMCRSQKEWHNREIDATRGGKWDYTTNRENLDRFWAGGVERNKHTEDIVTIGMRGDGDMAMSEERNVKLLEEIVANQRKMIARAHGTSADKVPQLWALYKEVQDYYDDGMRVPDDVTILLCDDNWGDVRRVPTAKEARRKGGWGLYYHVDYVGAPRNSKWLNVTSAQHMWEQLSLAFEYKIDRLWILNVGDLKPMEYPIQLFMDMAWKPETTDDFVPKHLRDFCARQFGESQAEEAADILDRCCRMNARSTAEMLDATTYNLSTGEWQQVVEEYRQLEIEALRQYSRLPERYRDAYRELILFPVEAMSNLHAMYHAQAMNHALHAQGDAAMNDWAERCALYFKRDSMLMHQYNKEIAGGKWDGMMIQKHIGYTTWQDDFPHDIMPQVYRTSSTLNLFDEAGTGFVAMEAEHFAWKRDAKGATWQVVPGMGRTLGGVLLLPHTESVEGASLLYRFRCSKGGEQVKVHIITKSTLDFLNKGGLQFAVQLDGCAPVTVNLNGDLNEKPENIYRIYYPTVARRVIDTVVELPLGATADFCHTLTFLPKDPGIVLEKVVVDCGGYQEQYLFGTESKRECE
jgi:hypothetical protein